MKKILIFISLCLMMTIFSVIPTKSAGTFYVCSGSASDQYATVNATSATINGNTSYTYSIKFKNIIGGTLSESGHNYINKNKITVSYLLVMPYTYAPYTIAVNLNSCRNTDVQPFNVELGN